MQTEEGIRAFDGLCSFLDTRKLSFDADRETGKINITVKGNDYSMHILLFFNEIKKTMQTIVPVISGKFEQGRINEVSALINAVNDNILFGKFVVRPADGRFAYFASTNYRLSALEFDCYEVFFDNITFYVDTFNDILEHYYQGKLTFDEAYASISKTEKSCRFRNPSDGKSAYSVICSYFDGKGWDEIRDESSLSVKVNITGSDVPMPTIIYVEKDAHFVCLRTVLTDVPQSKADELLLALPYTNLRMDCGCFFFEKSESKLYFRQETVLSGGTTSPESVKYLITTSVNTVESFNNHLTAFINGKITFDEYISFTKNVTNSIQDTKI